MEKVKLWKTIKLGTGLKTVNDFRAALHVSKTYYPMFDRFRLTCGAVDILRKPAFKAADEETEIDLAKVMVGELGFKKGAHLDQIYERAQEFSLELCPPEVGPQLRLQYQDQPLHEWIHVAMEPILTSDGHPCIFLVDRDPDNNGEHSEPRLHCKECGPDDFWVAGEEWVFRCSRKHDENQSSMIVRLATVNRDRTPQEVLTPQQVLDITGRTQYPHISIPSGGTGIQRDVEVVFFRLGYYVRFDELVGEYEARGLTPDLYAQAAVNEVDSAFADEHPNGTCWKDAEGSWCFAAFDCLGAERPVLVNCCDGGCHGYWWFGGVRKPA